MMVCVVVKAQLVTPGQDDKQLLYLRGLRGKHPRGSPLTSIMPYILYIYKLYKSFDFSFSFFGKRFFISLNFFQHLFTIKVTFRSTFSI